MIPFSHLSVNEVGLNSIQVAEWVKAIREYGFSITLHSQLDCVQRDWLFTLTHP